MDENLVTNNVENENSVVNNTSSEDSMFMMLFKMIVIVLIGGAIVKLFRRFVNWVKEGQRLRKEEKKRKQDELVEKKAQEKLDAWLAQEVEAKEESEKK